MADTETKRGQTYRTYRSSLEEHRILRFSTVFLTAVFTSWMGGEIAIWEGAVGRTKCYLA